MNNEVQQAYHTNTRIAVTVLWISLGSYKSSEVALIGGYLLKLAPDRLWRTQSFFLFPMISRFLFFYMLCLFCHVFDDYVLQAPCLCNLKQKSWWDKQLERSSEIDKAYYRHDYLMGLICHAMSWSVCIMIPLIYTQPQMYSFYVVAFLLNTTIHAWVDHLKANVKVFNLVLDQCIHFIQIFGMVFTWFTYISVVL